MDGRYLRHAWDHHGVVHRTAVKAINRMARHVPFGLKYGLGRRVRASKPPYCYLGPGARVVQVGAPSDTLYSGRSRGLYFSLLAGPTGRVVIVEPDQKSAERFRAYALQHHLDNVSVFELGAWNETKQLKIYVDDAHPASNFTEGSKEYDEARLAEYREVSVPVDTIDNILHTESLDRVDLVSITTNGAEREILEGMKTTIDRGLPYIALARTGVVDDAFMNTLGYEQVAFDDRGFTYRKI